MPKQKILLMTYGTRGDVEPFIALAIGLRDQGFAVTIATAERYSDWISEFDIDVAPLSNGSIDRFNEPDMRKLVERNSNFFERRAAYLRLRKKSKLITAELIADCIRVIKHTAPDLIVFHPELRYAPHIAEATGTPIVMAILQPSFVPTREFPPVLLPRLPIPGWNRLAYRYLDYLFWRLLRRINAFRTSQLNLGKVYRGRDVLRPPGAGPIPMMHAFSAAAIPRPQDWPDDAHLTGYWQLHDAEAATFEPPKDLEQFLAAGPPPVYVGFGSMKSNDAAALTDMVTQALRSAGVRGVIAAGWAGLDQPASDDIITIPEVPHSWLFPKMAAVVHHGGAGTTAHGLYAGVPCVICPFFADQPDWARRSVTLGVGATPVPRRSMTVERLASSIRQAVTDEALARNAKQLAKSLAVEDGVGNAIAIIKARLNGT